MNHSDLPVCPRCGSHAYQGGGGTWGGSLSHSFSHCTKCELGVFQYGYSYGHRLRVWVERNWGATQLAEKPGYSEDRWHTPQEHRPIWSTPAALVLWLNEAMMPTWKWSAARIKEDNDAFTEISWALACDAIHVPRKTKFTDFPKGPKDLFRNAVEDNPDFKGLYWSSICDRVTGSNFSEEYLRLLARWKRQETIPMPKGYENWTPVLTPDSWDAKPTSIDWKNDFRQMQKAWDIACEAAGVPQYTTFPELPRTPYNIARDVYDDHSKLWMNVLPYPFPPQAGDALAAVYRMEHWDNDWGTWVLVTAEESAKHFPKPDPTRVWNAAYFRDVWVKLSENLGVLLPYPSKTKNEYGGVEDWYTFTLNGAVFKVGWRKRVVNVEVEYPGLVDVTDISAVAKGDGTTYEAYGLERTMTLQEHLGKEWEEADEDQRAMLLGCYPDGMITTRKGGWQDDMSKAQHVCVHAWTKDKLVEYLTLLVPKANYVPEGAPKFEATDWEAVTWDDIAQDYLLGALAPTLPPANAQSEKVYESLRWSERDAVMDALVLRMEWEINERGSYTQSSGGPQEQE